MVKSVENQEITASRGTRNGRAFSRSWHYQHDTAYCGNVFSQEPHQYFCHVSSLMIKKSISPTSFGFSGAGFLVSYHLGVAACLLEHGHVIHPRAVDAPLKETVLTGVSGGALVVAALYAGIAPVDGMNCVLEVSRRTREKCGIFDCLTPGFSLIDEMEDIFLREMKLALGGSTEKDGDDYDNELFQGRMQGGKLMRIGLTDRRVFPPLGYNEKAYVYVDQYRDVEDVVAACVLSSYVPGVTGPALGSHHGDNLAVKRASKRVHEMESLGFVKKITGEPVIESKGTKTDAGTIKEEENSRETYWDGGLVNVFPVVDETTIVVSPIIGRFHPHPSIAPEVNTFVLASKDSSTYTGNPLKSLFPDFIRDSHRAEIALHSDNLDSLRRMTLSSDDTVLQERFARGFDDAKRFLSQNNLTTAQFK